MTVKVLVPISGGKDSQAALKLALQQYPASEVRGLFCDTQFEHPLTYAHVEELRTLYGPIRIDTVCGGSVLEKSVKYGRFPGGGARHCTDELKIRETKIYAKALAEEQGSIFMAKGEQRSKQADGGFEVWYGMRLQESPEREKRYAGKVCDELYAPHEMMASKYHQRNAMTIIDSDSIERRAQEAAHAGASFCPSISPQEILELVRLYREAIRDESTPRVGDPRPNVPDPSSRWPFYTSADIVMPT